MKQARPSPSSPARRRSRWTLNKLYDAVLARYDAGNFSELTFDYDTVPCESVDLKPYYDKYCTEMTDAYYDEEKHELVPEVKGFGFDLEYYTQQIAMADAGQTFTIQMKDLVPEVTLESLEKEYFSTTLAKYDSPHVVNADRTKNLELACAAIDGTILNPGEIFSFNKVVGERTPEKGYRPATIYQAGGKSEAETGGGVCQVASTIYETVLYADLDVVERAPHMFTVTYVDMGQDATIYWGSLDFKFKNSTKHPIRIDASVSGGYVHIALVGTAEEKDYDHIKMTYTTLSTTPWKTVGVLSADAKDEDAFEITVDAAGHDRHRRAGQYLHRQERAGNGVHRLVRRDLPATSWTRTTTSSRRKRSQAVSIPSATASSCLSRSPSRRRSPMAPIPMITTKTATTSATRPSIPRPTPITRITAAAPLTPTTPRSGK